MAPAGKQVLLRLDQDLADRLSAVAEVEGRSVSDVIREAIGVHVERRRRDPAFKKLLAEHQRRVKRLYRMLGEDGDG
jgi:predicted transcriptional regulator